MSQTFICPYCVLESNDVKAFRQKMEDDENWDYFICDGHENSQSNRVFFEAMTAADLILNDPD